MSPKLDEGYCTFGAGVLSRYLSALRGEMEGVRQAEDIEFVHRMRVASRRLRSALPQFESCFPKKPYKDWVKQIRKITQALGAARDTDVQIQALEQAAAEANDPTCQPGLRRMLLRLNQRRTAQQVDVLEALDHLQASGALEELEKRLAPFLARQDLVYLYTPYVYLRGYEAIASHLHDFLEYEQYIFQPECVEELHAMRIAAKRLRYTMEIFAPIYPGELKSGLQVVRKMQELLGEIHDSDVWGILLPEFLQQEHNLIVQFYGRARGYQRIVPGIQYLIDNRRHRREQMYLEFISTWQKSGQPDTWKSLLASIQIPFHQGEQLDPGSAPLPEAGKENRK